MGTDAERECWELRSGAGVGPLQFGMSPAEVAQALLVPGPQELVGGPYAQEDFPDGVKAFYDAGKLACVALDAVTGPQVFLSGFPLAGSDREQGQQFLLDHAAKHGNWVLYTPDDSLSLTEPLSSSGSESEDQEHRRRSEALERPRRAQDERGSMSLFHPGLEGEMGWSAGVVTRQGPWSLAW
ncbi:hypothetical protein [Streptomyces sp. NPDC047981]|uniref:hypothetical protein n=1 Tax=Streptomyces sp. NPDC047981 TaxID=3154610 RepID=UPI00343A4FFD